MFQQVQNKLDANATIELHCLQTHYIGNKVYYLKNCSDIKRQLETKLDLQPWEFCRSQEKQLREDSQIIPIQAPGKTE